MLKMSNTLLIIRIFLFVFKNTDKYQIQRKINHERNK